MAKKREPSSKPADQAVSPITGVAPPVEHRFKPGQSGNPEGRPPAGATIREHVNALAQSDLTEAELRRMARDPKLGWTRRAAAERILRTMESGDLADFEPVIRGYKTLEQARAEGINTELLKKFKVGEKSIELELHDRAGADFDRICDRTEGKPKQALDLGGEVKMDAVVMRVVGPRRPAPAE